MIVFGLVSSAFDFLAFGLLLFVFGAGTALFRTAWFVLSLLTELVVIFVVRTRGSVQGSRPSATLAWSAAATGAVALILPFVPVGAAFRLVPLPGAVLAALVLLTLAYGVATEGAKRWFYRKLEPA
jgi:P-type Mg2+ transporter